MLLLIIEFPTNLKSKNSLKSSLTYGYVSETMFEPLNALLLPDTTEAFIPFVAGWVTDEKDQLGNYLTKDFESIDIYKIDGEEKIYVKTIQIGVTLESSYNISYNDYSGNDWRILKVEPELKQDNEGNYYICYDNTLKQAIGFAQGDPPPSWGIITDIGSKIYDSQNAPGCTNVEINLSDVWENPTKGNNYVLIFEAHFEGLAPTERVVTLYYRDGYNEIFPLGEWYKGDGHIHSYYDGRGQHADKRIEHSSKNDTEKIKMSRIAHYKRVIQKFRWLIMTTHADYFWPNQTHCSCSRGSTFNEETNYTEYKGAVNTAQNVEREEDGGQNVSKFKVVPAEELTLCWGAGAIECPHAEPCFCCEGSSAAPDILNYRGFADIEQHLVRYSNQSINKKNFIRGAIPETCAKDHGRTIGPKGWSIIAHPSFSLTKDEWNYTWNIHPIPSIIRSFGDDDQSNDGLGIIGVEMFNESVCRLAGHKGSMWEIWHNYLYTDIFYTFLKWNNDSAIPGSEDYANNFVVGVSNSDCHDAWWYRVEDIVALIAADSSGLLTIPDKEEREVPNFEYYLMSRFEPVYGTSCTFVNIPGFDGSDDMLIRSLRGCGKEHKGITASEAGGWGTFTASGIISGGKTEVSPAGIDISLFAKPALEKGGAVVGYAIYGKSDSGPDDGPPWKPRVIKYEEFLSPGLPELSETVHIAQNELYGADYIVVEFVFRDIFDYRDEGSSNPSYHGAFANPVFIAGGTKQ